MLNKIDIMIIAEIVIMSTIILCTFVYLGWERSSMENRIEHLEMVVNADKILIETYDMLWNKSLISLSECRNETQYLRENCIWECPYCPTYPFAEAARDVAKAHEYDRYMYNCADYTDDLVLKLKGMGYEAYAIWGQSEWGYHAWTKLIIYIESTTGEILNPVYYIQNYGANK